MNDWPYHQYLFFELERGFWQLSATERSKLNRSFTTWTEGAEDVKVETYATLSFKPHSAIMLWTRAHSPEALQNAVRDLMHTPIGEWLTLTSTLFGVVRPSPYSGRHQSGGQVIRANERLPYLIVYPFTKTHDWYQLDMETRRQMMGEHVKVGFSHTDIRQLLLYGTGLEDHEFVVSYETPTLELFQDLVVQLRSTEARKYTANDQPTYLCIHKPLAELAEWL